MNKTSELTTIYIVRHGETDFNAKEILQGQADIPLNAKGEAQAEDLAKVFNSVTFDAVFSSDLIRAKRTAEILTMNKLLVVNTSKLIRERSFGKWEGQPASKWREETKAILEKLETISEAEKRKLKYDEVYESEDELVFRLLIFLREVAVAYLGKTVLVVSHGGIMRALLLHLGFASFSELRGKAIGNLAFIKLESDGVDFFIKETMGVTKNISK